MEALARDTSGSLRALLGLRAAGATHRAVHATRPGLRGAAPRGGAADLRRMISTIVPSPVLGAMRRTCPASHVECRPAFAANARHCEAEMDIAHPQPPHPQTPGHLVVDAVAIHARSAHSEGIGRGAGCGASERARTGPAQDGSRHYPATTFIRSATREGGRAAEAPAAILDGP